MIWPAGDPGTWPRALGLRARLAVRVLDGQPWPMVSWTGSADGSRTSLGTGGS
jgi:hypothetical protein